jgi:hypothetical protein
MAKIAKKTIKIADGTVTLRGAPIAIDSDIGREFVISCSRNWEKLLSDADLCDRFGLTLDQWRASGSNKALVRAVQLEHERRIRNGSAAQEAAAREFFKAPGVLGGIMRDESNNPRHRIDAANSLRQAAVDPASEARAQGQVFSININFGTNKITKEIELSPAHTADRENWEMSDG